jgi:hypothetical protein
MFDGGRVKKDRSWRGNDVEKRGSGKVRGLRQVRVE